MLSATNCLLVRHLVEVLDHAYFCIAPSQAGITLLADEAKNIRKVFFTFRQPDLSMPLPNSELPYVTLERRPSSG